MGMNMSSGSGGDVEPMMEMNMTPMIDVMLVLIIMFITTLPVANHAVNLNMPNNTPSAPPPEPPEVIKIDVDFDGTISWNGEVVNRSKWRTLCCCSSEESATRNSFATESFGAI